MPKRQLRQHVHKEPSRSFFAHRRPHAQALPLMPLQSIDLAHAGQRSLETLLAWPLQSVQWLLSPFTSWMSDLQQAQAVLPHFETRETDKAHLYIADLDGVPRGQLSLILRGGMLVLRISSQANEHNFHSARSVFRAMSLPVYIDASAIAAKFKDGVLTVTIPKSAKPVPPRKPVIPIH